MTTQQRPNSNSYAHPAHPRDTERGAILLVVAVALLGLLAFSAFSIDHGVMMVSRGQAQNAADAGALAAASYLAFNAVGDQAGAQVMGEATAEMNHVWGQPPDVTPADITFPPCPPGAPGPPDQCVRVDVFRNQRPGGSPLPVFFASLVGTLNQGVRATATAQILMSDSAECLKPWAVLDKWVDTQPGGWNPDAVYDEEDGDYYVPPTFSDPGSGFTVEADYGQQLILKAANGNNPSPSWYGPVVINPTEGQGASVYRENIRTCDMTRWSPDSWMTVEPGNMVGPTRQGVNDLVALDWGASWDPDRDNGPGMPPGGPVGGCMSAHTCDISPRVGVLPVVDTAMFYSGRTTGRIDVYVRHLLGFWIEGMQGNDVIGYIMLYPAEATASSSLNWSSSFLRTVVLVR